MKARISNLESISDNSIVKRSASIENSEKNHTANDSPNDNLTSYFSRDNYHFNDLTNLAYGASRASSQQSREDILESWSATLRNKGFNSDQIGKILSSYFEATDPNFVRATPRD